MKALLKPAFAAALSMAVASTAFAQENGHGAHHPPVAADSRDTGVAAATAEKDAAWSEGVVRKVDKSTGKLTIRHGELANLGMPAMTMVYRVKDPAMLEQVKAGDRIAFVADRIEGQFIVMQLQVQK